MPRSLRISLQVLFATWVTLVVGCGGGGKKVAVEGTVKFPAQMKLADQDGIELRFEGEGGDAAGKGGSTTISPKDSTFAIKGLVSGKYKVVIQVVPYPGLPGNDKRARAFETFNRSHDSKQSSIFAEIGTEPEQKLTIDVEKKTVTKQ